MCMKRSILFLTLSGMALLPLVSQDWPMWGGTEQRNMTSAMRNLPEFWDVKNGKNIKWKVEVADGKVYLGDQDGDVAVLKAGTEVKKISEIDMGNSVYSTPVPANGVLYIMTRSELYAIAVSAGGSDK